MGFLSVFSGIYKGIKNVEKASDNFINKRHMEIDFSIEENFLELISEQAKKVSSKKNDLEASYIRDFADDLYYKMKALDELSDNKTTKSILEYKKDFFIHDFDVIECAKVTGDQVQNEVNRSFGLLISKRNKMIEDLKLSIGKSKSFADVFCVYLARSNYPKKDAFEILPIEMSVAFDRERENSVHLKGVKILASIID